MSMTTRYPWIEDHDKVCELARWLLTHEQAFESAADAVAYFEKPWHWNDEREVMLGNKFYCASCSELNDVTSEALAERVEEGVDCYCADCAAERAAEAKAETDEDVAEARAAWDAKGEP